MRYRRFLILISFAIHSLKVLDIVKECKNIKTIIFNVKETPGLKDLVPKPGQFVMVWVPGVDEIPMSVAGCDDNGNWSIIVKNIGECTKALHNLKKGDIIGIRGPLGTSFKLPSKENVYPVLISGGTGIAPLNFLAMQLIREKFKFNFIHGAQSTDELIHLKIPTKSQSKSFTITYCTDDGSEGLGGDASQLFEDMMNSSMMGKHTEIVVYTCGPERMMLKVAEFCQNKHLRMQASLERIMRCGCGLCGLCSLDPLGLLVCKDGPVFDLNTLNKLTDFGHFKRDFTGKKISL
jgi:dihydroorotate dehydrogenase electron transfer subunit